MEPQLHSERNCPGSVIQSSRSRHECPAPEPTERGEGQDLKGPIAVALAFEFAEAALAAAESVEAAMADIAPSKEFVPAGTAVAAVLVALANSGAGEPVDTERQFGLVHPRNPEDNVPAWPAYNSDNVLPRAGHRQPEYLTCIHPCHRSGPNPVPALRAVPVKLAAIGAEEQYRKLKSGDRHDVPTKPPPPYDRLLFRTNRELSRSLSLPADEHGPIAD